MSTTRLTVASSPEHEALCRRCGASCHFAVPVNGLAVVLDELRCRFLARDDAGGFHCSVYAERMERAPWCQTVEEALAGGYLAQDCPYARSVEGYRGKVRLQAALMQKVRPAIRAEIARGGVPSGADPDAALRLLEEDGSCWRYELSADGTRYVFLPAG